MRSIAYCLIVVCGILGFGLNVIAAPVPYDAETCSATDITSDSATLSGKAYDSFSSPGSPMIVWFQYGTVSGLYSGTSTTQNVTSGAVTEISVGVSGLSLHTSYYYRIAAQSQYELLYGRERSFVTLPTTSTTTETIPMISSTSGSGCHSASGKITDAITGKGIESAMVMGGLGISSTDASGFYSWFDPEEIMCCGGSYTLTASADGYISQSQSIEIDPQQEGTLNFELQPICVAEKITIFPRILKIERGQSSEVTITLEGDNCVPEGKTVTATIGKAGKRRISISSASEVTDANGEAKFTIAAKDKIGKARIIIKTGNLKKTILVKIK